MTAWFFVFNNKALCDKSKASTMLDGGKIFTIFTKVKSKTKRSPLSISIQYHVCTLHQSNKAREENKWDKRIEDET